MTLFLLLSKWREILIGLLAFLLIICLALWNHKAGQVEKYKQAENTKVSVELKEKQWSEQQLKAEQNYNATIKQIKSDADLAQSCADSLSKQLKITSSRLSSAPKETIIEYTIANSDILEKYITEYQEVVICV